MGSSKRHHYVPRMLVRRFANERGTLFFFSKGLKEKGVMETTPQNLFVEGHLYSIVREDGSRDDATERIFSYIESEASQIIDKIVGAVREGREPNLTEPEKTKWDTFYYHQWVRVPGAYETIVTLKDAEAWLDDFISRFETIYRPLSDDEKALLAKPEERARIIRNANVMALAEPGTESMKALQARGLAIAIIAQSRKSFIVGSVPIAKLNQPRKTALEEPTVQIWLPIATDIAVGPMGPPATEAVQLFRDRQIRALNEAILAQSDVVAGPVYSLIASLARS